MKTWLNDERAAVDPALYAAVKEEQLLGPCCEAEEPRAGYLCTRRKGHPGRHLATTTPNRKRVSAAWPGDHEPTIADLERS
jgi:hypothetical protein